MQSFNALFTLDPNKASRLDKIGPSILKYSASILSKPLHYLLFSCYVPPEMKLMPYTWTSPEHLIVYRTISYWIKSGRWASLKLYGYVYPYLAGQYQCVCIDNCLLEVLSGEHFGTLIIYYMHQWSPQLHPFFKHSHLCRWNQVLEAQLFLILWMLIFFNKT